MSERRRLKAGVEVQVCQDGSFLMRLGGQTHAFPDGGKQIRALTEPIPEEPAGPKVGDEVTARWLASEWDEARHHVVRNPDGSAASWQGEVEGTRCVEDADGRYAETDSEATWPILALHPVERWEETESDTTEPPLNVRMDCAEEFASELERRIEELKRSIEALFRVTDGHRRGMADDIQRLHHAVHVELEDRIEALEKDSHPPVRIPLGEIEARIEVLEARTSNILTDMPWLDPNPKEVMPDAGGSLTDNDSARDVAPLPGAEQDAPGGEGPSVEKVLEALECYSEPMPQGSHWEGVPYQVIVDTAARIIREQREEIEGWQGMYRDVCVSNNRLRATARRWLRIIRERGEEIERLRAVKFNREHDSYMRGRGDTDTLRAQLDHEVRKRRSLEAEVASLTERLTITPEKVKAAYEEQGRHHIRDDPAMVCILTAAGMIDPEVEG